ncbi:MAG: NADPH:quinone reductase [Gammaproteobacteria bacterium]|nr:NADPH:quinone reductase [Gammaproteobacteria bacterium]
MRAIVYERVGAAREVLRLVELPLPEPGPGEVRVRLATSGVNPSDVKSRAGTRSKVLPFPSIVPHSDGAGIVDAVGPGVPASRIGQRVWIWNAAWGRAHGTAAEYVALPAAQAVPLPDDVDFAAAACLGIPALTAFQAIAVDGGVAGKTVLVAGGAGAVGHYAIQFAKTEGAARVLATVSSAGKAALARAAGADEVIDYRTENLVERVAGLTAGAGVDRIVEVDFAANVAADVAMVKPDGDIVVYGSGAPEIPVPFVGSILKNIRYRFFIVYHLTPADRARAETRLTALLAAGRLVHNVACRVPLEDTALAHQLVEQGAVPGNVVINID